jgi:EpsI family protein
MVGRALTVVALVTAAGLYTTRASGADVPVSRVPLESLATTIDAWRGYEAKPFSDDIVAELGVDDYVNRHYTRSGVPPVTMYVGYYGSQRQGDTIHSPRNCLPGAGWRPVWSETGTIAVAQEALPVNRYLIQRGLDRQAVVYWYQGRGRVIANEYANKMWLMVDAARLRRTDGALVRLITPVASTPEAAFGELTAFTTALYPRLRAHLP